MCELCAKPGYRCAHCGKCLSCLHEYQEFDKGGWKMFCLGVRKWIPASPQKGK
jgi:hypothetical protein